MSSRVNGIFQHFEQFKIISCCIGFNIVIRQGYLQENLMNMVVTSNPTSPKIYDKVVFDPFG